MLIGINSKYKLHFQSTHKSPTQLTVRFEVLGRWFTVHNIASASPQLDADFQTDYVIVAGDFRSQFKSTYAKFISKVDDAAKLLPYYDELH